jgi:hypothetical protein
VQPAESSKSSWLWREIPNGGLGQSNPPFILPAELPVVQPVKLEPVINLKIAKTPGIDGRRHIKFNLRVS